MKVPHDESLMICVEGMRKGSSRGGGNACCEIGVTILTEKNGAQTIVLRTEDKSGVAPIVIKLDRNLAMLLGEALIDHASR